MVHWIVTDVPLSLTRVITLVIRHSVESISKHDYSRVHAFHHAEDSENFGRKSNEKVCFGFFRPEYSELLLEVVHFDWSDQNLPLRCNSEKGKRWKSHSSWLARFNWKMLFHFPRVLTLVSDRLSGIGRVLISVR